MKTLFLSLLRFGDLFTHMQIIDHYLKSNPRKKIHVLTNIENQAATGILDKRIQWHFFKHREWGLNAANPLVPRSKILCEVDKWLLSLSQEGFADLYNLTNTRLSAKIAGILQAKNKFGVWLEGQSLQVSNPQWGHFSNSYLSRNKKLSFSSIELISKANNLNYPLPPENHKPETDLKLVVLQVSSNEKKKELPLQVWQEFAATLESRDFQVKVLCAPGEKSKLQPFLEPYLFEGEFVDFKEVILKANFLVSLDTAVLHLAALLGVPSYGIYVGSGNAFTNFPHSAKARCLVSRQQCYPCSHRKPCVLASTECSDPISAQILDSFVFSERFSSANFLRAEVKFSSEKLELFFEGESMKAEMIERSVSRAVWEMFLEESYSLPLAPYGSVANQIADEAKEHSFLLKKLLSQTESALETTQNLKSQAKSLHHMILKPTSEGLLKKLRSEMKLALEESQLAKHEDECLALREVVQRDHESPFSFYRQLKKALFETETVLNIRATLLAKALLAIGEKTESKNLCLKN
jgi:ADP-heptose:LPS heptosyltransferase